jgi:adenylate cyclase
MGENEEATLRTLSSHRKLIDSLIEQHHGRFVNSAGDSVLAEFASVVNAVQCAVEIQTTLKTENSSLPPERRMEFRIGINLGDVMVDGEQIYGDGVNVAARLESLADPGGICVSDTVHAQIKNKLALAYEDLGAQSVKNLAEPVRVFRVMLEGRAANLAATKATHRSLRKHWRAGVFSLAGLALVAAVIVFVQHLSLRPPTTTASIPPAQKPAPPLPSVPSIAVLPFTNMSGDREQEYFSDGITDDLTTALSRIPNLFVIARTSAFTYKGKAAKVQDIGRELGVQYLLEGSVRKAGDTLRITAQLVDATTGDHLWAGHYDRPLRDIFLLQDEIGTKIVTTLKLRLSVEKWREWAGQHTDNLEAYDYYLRCVGYGLTFTEEDNAKGGRMCEKALELDPAYADAYMQLGFHYLVGFAFQWSQYGGPGALDRAIRLEQQAIGLDDTNATSHAILGRLYLSKRQYDESAAEIERAIALLAPGSAFGNYWVAFTLSRSGKPAESLAYVGIAERLDPQGRGLYEFERANDYVLLGRYQEAAAVLRKHLVSYPNNLSGRLLLAVVYIELNLPDEARAQAAEVMRISPHFSIEGQKKILSFKNRAAIERLADDARKAGLK